MTRYYSIDETIDSVALLTETRLTAYIEAEVIMPTHTETGPVFRQVDLVRMEFLCELSEHFSIDEDVLGIVISLIDQLHGTRAELRALLSALEEEPADVRARIASALARNSD